MALCRLLPLQLARGFKAYYRIAVPSYDRANTILRTTLSALAETGIDCSSRVDVLVANQAGAAKYAAVLQPRSYSSITVGRLGIGQQRAYILDYYGAGCEVVMVVDDLQRFLHVYDDAAAQLDLHMAILRSFQLSHEHGCYMWGLSNSSNKFFMDETYSVGWCFFFFQGPFMAFRVRECVRLHPQYNAEEDVQFSLMHCDLDDKVLRLNGQGLKAKPFGKEPGGLQTHLTAAQRKAQAAVNREYLLLQYGRCSPAVTTQAQSS